MNKAIALAAIAALAMGSEQFGDDELNVFKSIGNGLKKAGHYVAEHPQIIAQGAKILAHDDEELFNIHNALHKAGEGAKKAGHYVAEHPEVINQAIQILKNFKHDDEELFNIKDTVHKAEHYVKDHRHQIEQGAKKAVDYIQQHPEVVNQAIEIIKNLRHHDDEELFHLGKAISKATHLVKDGANIVKDVKTGNIGGLINHGAQTIRDIKHDDEELFKLGKVVKNVAHAAGKVGHVVKDGANLYKDVQTGNIGGIINHGAQTIRDIKGLKHDDEELFNIHDAIHKAEEGVKKAGHFVYDHRQEIVNDAKKAYHFAQEHPEIVKKAVEIVKKIAQHDDEELFKLGKAISKATHLVKDGANIVKDVKTGNIGGLINHGAQTIRDIKHDDEELFKLGKVISKATHLVKDGANIVKDVKTGNIGGLINHGAQTIRDIKHDDEELFKLGKVVKNVAHAAGKVGHVVKDGVNLYKDVQTGNIGGIINHGAQTVRDIKGLKHDDEELFNIHNAIHKAEEGVKKAGHFVYEHRQEISHDLKKAYEYAQQHPEQVKKAIEIIKKIAHHDDEELFHLGKAIHNVAHAAGKVSHIAKDGINIVKDVKTGNIGGLINHGAQTIKDIKNLKHDDEELFHLGKAISKATHLVKDGANIVKDVKTGNIGGLINHGAQTIRDIKHDDEELFNLGTLINDGMNIYKDVKTHNYGGLIQDGVKTVKDVKEATHGKKFLRH